MGCITGGVWEGWGVPGPLSPRFLPPLDAGEEYGVPVVRAKRTRMGGDGDGVWFHRSIAGTVQAAGSGDGEEAEEEKVVLVPTAAAFPHGMSAAAAAAAGPALTWSATTGSLDGVSKTSKNRLKRPSSPISISRSN
jgi:hypothetical protein